jgi:hypothetical protein
MDSAWDRLLDLVDHLAADPERPVDAALEQQIATLGAEARQVGDIDAELDVDGVARWLAGLVVAHRAVRAAHPGIDPDADLGDLRRIITRWLHPARPR